MLSLGFLSFFQITFIPGFIALYILKFKLRNIIQTLILSFGISLAINYLAVYLLTLLGIYKSITFYIIFGIEIIVLVFILYRNYSNFSTITIRKDLNLDYKNKIIYNISLIFILLFILFFILNLCKVFNIWDDVFSWNKWAYNWYFNELPNKTGFYPQLIPANWSLTYLFIKNTEIQLFAKSIMPLFSLAIVAIFFELYISKKKIEYLTSLIIFGFINILYNFIHIQSGYVDIPVAFFSLISFYLIIDQYNCPLDLKKIFLIVLFASSAAITKQSGFFILLFAFLWVILIVFQKKEGWKKTFFAIFIPILTILIFLSWYFIKIYEIQHGLDFSNTYYLLHDIHGNLNYFERILSGLTSFPDYGIILIILLILAISGVFLKKYITVPIFIVIPYFLIWGLFFSYDRRNLSLILPFLALSSAFGISSIWEKINKAKVSKLYPDEKQGHIINWIYLIIIFLLSVIFISLRYILKETNGTESILKMISQIRGYPVANIWADKINDALALIFYIGILLFIYGICFITITKIFNNKERIIINLKFLFISFLAIALFLSIFAGLNYEKIYDEQIEQRKALGNKKLNLLIYDYKDINTIDGRIITNYYWLSVLPGFYSSANKIFIDNEMIQIISDEPPYSPFFEAIDSNTWGILISENYFSNEKFKDLITEKIETNEFEIIFQEGGYTIQKYYFIRINHN